MYEFLIVFGMCDLMILWKAFIICDQSFLLVKVFFFKKKNIKVTHQFPKKISNIIFMFKLLKHSIFELFLLLIIMESRLWSK